MVQYLNISTVVIIFLGAVFWRTTFVRANVNHQFDFRDFLNTSEDIWTYASTWNASFICRKDNVTGIINSSVSFLTTCYENGRWDHRLCSKRDSLSLRQQRLRCY
uniref:Putative lipocalin n=1 Tax=Rhipicephalus microplus TaxID=6941 RepID=A0A6G5A262_RHIMP